MISVLVHILLGIVLSFIGSIPFGTINVTVIESAIMTGFRKALWVIAGAALIEFIQALVALRFAALITQYPVTEQILFWSSIPIFIGLAIYYFMQKGETKQDVKASSSGRGFLKGVVVSSLNVLAIPYWIFYGTYLNSIQLIDTTRNFNIIVFSLGVLTGTTIILAIYAKLGEYAKTKFSRITTYIAPGVAIFFLVLAAIQIVRGVMQLMA